MRPASDFEFRRSAFFRPSVPRPSDFSAAPKALAAVEALVTGAIADGDVAAVWAGRRVGLKMSDGIAQAFNQTRAGCMVFVSVAV